MGRTAVSNKVPTTGDLEALTETASKLHVVSVNEGGGEKNDCTTHSLVAVGDASVDDANLGTLAKDAELMKTADTGGVVMRVRQGGGAVGLLGLDGSELDLLVQPDLDNVGEVGQGIGVELLGFDADTGEDLALESLQDLDTGGISDLLLTLLERGLQR